LYSGTPGSGKSLHLAEKLYYRIRSGRPTICNFDVHVNYKKIKAKRFYDSFRYIDNLELTPQRLIDYSQKLFKNKRPKEGSILLVIDDIITAIPFIRNLIEYANSMEDENYKKLTSLLHIKKDTLNITVKDLENIFEKSVTFSEELNFSNGREDEKVYDLIIKTAKNIVKSGESSIDLDGKIILSMAIRLLAERFMINEITVVDKSGNVLEEVYKQNNQTGKLLGQYKKLCSEQHDNILLMNKVSLMSSENIHINSFMFEPIIDMSIKSLVDLFGRVSLLVD